MTLQEVNTRQENREWIRMPGIIYKNDPNYIRPLDHEIAAVFDPDKNKLLKNGQCIRWILKDEQNHITGRIAAFINPKYKMEQPTGGIGFFECINNQQHADMLLDAARNWLEKQGMEAMDGPINFGERDKWWGLQIAGFQPPLYGMNYNPPYYQQLLESYGFKPYFYQECFGRKVHKGGLKEKFYTLHDKIAQDKNFSALPVRKNNLDKFARDFTIIYNKAWAAHGQGKTMNEKQAKLLFQSMKVVLDERIAWFAYYKEAPVAFWLNLPDLNEYFKDFDGRLGLLQKLTFLWRKWRAKATRMVGIVYGVVPEFQARGVDAFLIVEGSRVIWKQTRYEDYEMQWIGDFNPKMINIAKSLDMVVTRRLCTYRYLFDRSRPFTRCPILGKA